MMAPVSSEAKPATFSMATASTSNNSTANVYRPPRRTSIPPPPTILSVPSPSPAPESTRASARPQAPKIQLPRTSSYRKDRALLTAYGDSFVGPLELLGDKVVVKKYSGASAKGLNNPKSVSQTGQELLFHLDRFRPSRVLLIFGHVDLQVVYLFKVSEAERLCTAPPDPDAWVKTVFDAYATYLREKILPHVALSSSTPAAANSDAPAEGDPDRFITQLYIASVTAPTVPDDHLDECSEKYNESAAAAWQEKGIKLGSARAPTDLATRRKMIVDFNKMLEDFCEEVGAPVRYVDINPRITDSSTGEVLPPYLVPDKSTIHVVWETTIGFWVDALRDTGLSEADIPPDLEESLKSYEEDKKGRMQRRSPTPRKHMRYSSANPSTNGASSSSPATPTQPGTPFGSGPGRDGSVRTPFGEPRASPFGESSRGSAFSHMQPRNRDSAGEEKRAVYRPPHSRASASSSAVPSLASPTSAVSPTSTLTPTPTSAVSATSSTANDSDATSGRPRVSGRWTNVVPQDDPRRKGSFVHGFSSHRRQMGSIGGNSAPGASPLEKPMRGLNLLDAPMGSIGSQAPRDSLPARKDEKA